MSLVSIDPNAPQFRTPDGQPFFILGVNYEGYFDRAWAMWRLYDPQLIKHDFQKARASGFNALRIFVQKENLDEVNQGRWNRFDTVMGLARNNDLYVMLTFNDYHSPHLASTGRFNAKIVEHFKGDPIILGWDLENEPRLYNLLTATYPDGPCPLLTPALVDRYGDMIPRSQVDMNRVPGPLRRDPNLAFYYVNAVEAYLRFSRDGNGWAGQNQATIVDYMRAPASEKWRPFLDLLDQTIAAWIKPQIEPMRAADPSRPTSIGWNWPVLAALPANRLLEYMQIHQYGQVGYGQLIQTFNVLRALRDTFPDRPVVMGEFGYSTDESKDPAHPRPVDPHIAALHEGALLCFLRAEGFAGGMKWMLNDVRGAPNPFEAGLGVYADQDSPKPSQRVYAHLAAIWRFDHEPGHLTITPDERSLIRYVYRGGQGAIGGGSSSPDENLSWQADRPTHVFVHWNRGGQTRLEASTQAEVQLKPVGFVPEWEAGQGAAVYRLFDDTFSPEGAQEAGQPVSVSLRGEFPRLLTPWAK